MVGRVNCMLHKCSCTTLRPDSQNIDLITNKFTQDASWTKDSSPVDSAESSAPTQTKDITLTATNRLNEATFQLGFHDFDISMDQQKVLQKTVPQVPSRFLSSSSTETTGSTDATQHPSIHAVRFKRKTSPVRMTPPRPVKLLSLINKMERSVGKVAKDGTSAAAEASSCNSDTDEVVSDVDDAEPSLDLLDMITGDQPSSSIVGGAPSESGDLADTEVTTNRAPAVTAATQLYPAMDEDLCPTQALPSEAESHVAQTSDPVDIPCAQLVSISDENGSPLTYFPVKRVNEHIEDMNDSISGEQDSLAKSGEESSAGLTHVTFGPNYSQRSGQFVGTQDVITSDLDPQLTPIDGTQEPTDECVANRSRADLDDGDGDDEHSTSMVEPATTVNMDESGILPQTDSLEVPDDADFTPASEVLGVDDTSSSMVFEPTTSLCDAGSDQSDTDAGDERGVHELTSVNSPDDNLVLEDSRVMVASPPAVTTVMATPVTASNPTVEPNTIIYSSGLRDDDDDENSPSPDHGEQSVMHEDTSPAASEISTAESSAADARPSYSQLRLEPIASSSMASTAPIVLLEQQHYVTPSSTSFGVADSDRFQVSFAWGSSSAATTEEESSLRKEQTSQMDATQTKDENPAVSTPSPTRDAAAQTSQSLSEILSAYNSPTKKRFTRDDERVVEVVSPRKCRPRHEVVIEIPIRPQSTSPRAVATTAAPKKRKLVRTRDIGKDSGDKSANGLNTIDDLFCRDDSKLQRDVEDELSGDQEQCDPNVLAMSDY